MTVKPGVYLMSGKSRRISVELTIELNLRSRKYLTNKLIWQRKYLGLEPYSSMAKAS